MDEILQHSKKFDQIKLEHDPMYHDVVKCTAYIKQYLVKSKRIVYGGTAIDFALRLKGDKEYPDEGLIVADLDFYSPTPVEDAIELCDYFFKNGYNDARVINARHIGSMKVDIGDNHFIADISYCPPKLYERLPTLVFEGMRIIHPIYQYIDMHTSLSTPFSNPPNEVIFERWKKDIKRFNKLYKYYPVDPFIIKYSKIPAVNADHIMAKLQPTDVSIDHKYVLHGFLAYAIIYDNVTKKPENVIKTKISFGETIKFTTYNSFTDIMVVNMEKFIEEMGGKLYEENFNLLGKHCVAGNIRAFDASHKFMTIVSLKINDRKIRIVSAQTLLQWFMAMFFKEMDVVYLMYYYSLLKIVEANSSDPLCDLSIKILAYKNVSAGNEIAINRMMNKLTGEELIPIPQTYAPGRDVSKMPNPPPPVPKTFDYESSKFFKKDGREIQI